MFIISEIDIKEWVQVLLAIFFAPVCMYAYYKLFLREKENNGNKTGISNSRNRSQDESGCGMSDLISRSALKKAITEATYNFEQIPIRVDKVQEIIDNAPTIEPERPQGEWITFPTSRLIMQCPKCTAFLSRSRSDIFKDNIGEMNFCPNCGADMRGEQE